MVVADCADDMRRQRRGCCRGVKRVHPALVSDICCTGELETLTALVRQTTGEGRGEGSQVVGCAGGLKMARWTRRQIGHS